MVALAILISLGAIAALAYQSYAKTVKTRLSAIQKMTIEDRVTTDFDLILRGVDVGLHLPGTCSWRVSGSPTFPVPPAQIHCHHQNQ